MKIIAILLTLMLSLNAFAINSTDRKIGTKILGYEPVTTTERDALTGVTEGAVVWNTTTGSLSFYNGATWITGAAAGNYITALTGDVTLSSYSAGSAIATISNDAITTAKIFDGSVTANKLASDSVTTVKILDDAVTASKLADSSVDLASATVTGLLAISNGGTGLSSVGTNGYFLKSNGSANVYVQIASSDVAYSQTTPAEWNTNPLFVGVALDELASRVEAVEVVDGNQILRNGSIAMTGNLDLGSQKIVSLADGTNTNDAVNKSQLDLKADLTALYPSIFGSRSVPRNIQAAGILVASSHMNNTSYAQDVYVCGSSAGSSCDANIVAASISQGTVNGQRICVVGRNAFSVEINASTSNVVVNGKAILGVDDSLCLRYDSVNWVEESRNF